MVNSIGHPPFGVDLRAHRIVWGGAKDRLHDELVTLNIRRFMLVGSQKRVQRFNELVGEQGMQRCAGQYVDVIPHVPGAMVDRAVATATAIRADGLVAFGGGSTLDTAKAVSHRLGLPILAIPTNFSGSEVTWNFGQTSNGIKQAIRNPAVLPKSVIYDPFLIESLPWETAVCSGVNAIAHAIEALYAQQANPYTRALAETGIRQMIAGLSELATSSGTSSGPRETCLMASWLCGEVLSQVGMGLHHRICHILGGTYGMPHAQTHSVLLPYSIAFNFSHAPALWALRDLFLDQSLAAGIQGLVSGCGAPVSLSALGLDRDAIAQVIRILVQTPIWNPRPFTDGDVHALLTDAYTGNTKGLAL